jgi:hypothetical protein
MIHVLVGAALPVVLFVVAWWRRGRRTSARALGWLAVGASLSGLAAILPDVPRLFHNLDLYFRMHRHPACDLAWFHCFIDRHDDFEDSRIIPVVFVLVAAAVVFLGWRELAAIEAAKPGERR